MNLHSSGALFLSDIYGIIKHDDSLYATQEECNIAKYMQTRTVEFRKIIDKENALRVRFQLSNGIVTHFVVQLECLIDGEWTPVIRYDTAHGFAHMDKLHPSQPAEKIELETQDYNKALTVAMDDLSKNWMVYHKRYIRWKKK